MVWVCGLAIGIAALEVRFTAMTALVMVLDAQAAQVFQRIGTAFGPWHDVVSYGGTLGAARCRAYPVTFQASSTQALPERGFVEVGHGAE